MARVIRRRTIEAPANGAAAEHGVSVDVVGPGEPQPAEPGGARADAAEGGGGEPAPARPTRGWRDRRMIAAAVVAVVSLSAAGGLALASRSGDGGTGDGGGEAAATERATPSTSMDAGGIDVPTPDGWSAAPVPVLGFGIAYPPGWEVAVLRPEMLNSLTRSDPAVTGFVDAAHAAARAGSVLYGAGEDDEGRITDLKIRADTESGVTDVAGLEDYARRLATEPGVSEPQIERVDEADRPTVRMRFRSTSESEDGERVTGVGIETLILGPRDVVWSLIVTGEDGALVDDLTPRLVDTFTLAPA